MKSYLVVEGPTDAALMSRLLKYANVMDTKIIEGGGKSSAMSLGNSIALTSQEPVAILVDADTTDKRVIKEQKITFEDLQRYAYPSTICKLFLASPTVEEELFPDVDSFENILNVDLSPEERANFAKQRRAIIKSYIHAPEQPIPVSNSKSARDGWGRPVFQELLSFLKRTSRR